MRNEVGAIRHATRLGPSIQYDEQRCFLVGLVSQPPLRLDSI